MHLLRTRIKKEIVSEFLPPMKYGRGGKKPANKVIILCGGMPGYPGGKTRLAEFLARKGYWVFIPRYRGSWESGGTFLKRSPHQDVLDSIDQLSRGFEDLWSGKRYAVQRAAVYVIGSSFGGAAAILASRDPRVRRAVALSPVTDWRVETKAEPIAAVRAFSKKAFGNAYRFDEKNWKKLTMGTFYNPAHEAASIDGKKILIVHAKDDKVVYAKTSVRFAKQTGANMILLRQGGHLSISDVMTAKLWKEIKKGLG